jgi:hypothetical protein
MVCVNVPDPLLCSTRFVAGFRQVIQIAILRIVEIFKYSDERACITSMISLSSVPAHGLS